MALRSTLAERLFKIITPKRAPNANYCDSCEKTQATQKKCTADSPKELGPDPQIIQIDTPEDARSRIMQKCKIVIREPDDYSLISGVPLHITCSRAVRIFQPPKNAQQQGTRHLGHWLIDFGTKERWENPLMGWCSSADPLSNLQVRFGTKEEAIAYCQKNHRTFWVQESKTHKKFKVKSYGMNFHHSRRTRVSTK
ncbi:NADH dehydrogenase [ubiquinone] iron-sulfur protein 4, mitochondrial [Dendroctonus ponderosae]|uniref:NADH dehydrogenase [ubiquinone] iron-sulfur protein 4, mitochondrial n=1 Tax=Dendroctonus ponderosae TaxID=77166 RepID=UPI002035B5D5|nr:NADH dehydrogenase [ubiquinone] iron-sulfur protein 4, mitochondrial [Dendroctonus ponderosae]KAH1010861.1 hypothetical protein HUJ05_005099 [Dendroctonus ponderosae]